MTTWKTPLIADERYKKFGARFTGHWSTMLDPQALSEEIVSLHLGRKSKDLRLAGEQLVQKIIEAASQDTAVRGRLCHIKVQVNDIVFGLGQYRDALIEHLIVDYTETLNDAGFRAKGSKVEAVNSLKHLKNAAVLLSEMNLLWSNCDIIIKDIDQAGFSLKHIIEALSLHTKREYAT